MAWIESHTNLETHPKIIKLCSRAKWTKSEAIGNLQRLWWWALTYAEDGDLNKYEPMEYLGSIRGNLTVEALYEILQDVGFIDRGKNLLHNWLKYAGRYLNAKYRTSNPKLLTSIVRKHKSNFSQTKGRLKSDKITLNNHTLNNHTKPKTCILSQIENLLQPLDSNLRFLFDEFIMVIRESNKTKNISDSRKARELSDLYTLYNATEDKALFETALLITCNKQVPNQNYIKAIIRSKSKHQTFLPPDCKNVTELKKWRESKGGHEQRITKK